MWFLNDHLQLTSTGQFGFWDSVTPFNEKAPFNERSPSTKSFPGRRYSNGISAQFKTPQDAHPRKNARSEVHCERSFLLPERRQDDLMASEWPVSHYHCSCVILEHPSYRGKGEANFGSKNTLFPMSWGYFPTSLLTNIISTKIKIRGIATHKNFHVDVNSCVDSESVLRNFISPCNLEIRLKNLFLLLPPVGSFLFRRKERYEQTDFKNEIYAYNRTGK